MPTVLTPISCDTILQAEFLPWMSSEVLLCSNIGQRVQLGPNTSLSGPESYTSFPRTHHTAQHVRAGTAGAKLGGLVQTRVHLSLGDQKLPVEALQGELAINQCFPC